MRKKLILINAGVVIVGLIAAFLLAMPQVQNLYKEEFARRLDTALAFMLSDTDRIAQDPQGFVEKEREILQQAGQDMRITIIRFWGTATWNTWRNPTRSQKTTSPARKSMRRNITEKDMIPATAPAFMKAIIMPPFMWKGSFTCGRPCP